VLYSVDHSFQVHPQNYYAVAAMISLEF